MGDTLPLEPIPRRRLSADEAQRDTFPGISCGEGWLGAHALTPEARKRELAEERTPLPGHGLSLRPPAPAAMTSRLTLPGPGASKPASRTSPPCHR